MRSFTITVRNTIALIAFVVLANPEYAAAQLRVPPPTGVTATAAVGVDATHGTFVLEWTPPSAQYTRFILPSGWWVYKGLPSGGSPSYGKAPGAQTLWEGPPYRVQVTGPCRNGTAAFFVATMPQAHLEKSLPVYATRFQVPCKK